VTRRILSASAEYQVLEALRTNRQKRNRENAFIVEGVRNVDAALAHHWEVRDALVPSGATRSAWAESVLERVGSTVEIAPELFGALSDRSDPPEVVLVVEKRRVALQDLPVDSGFVATVLDRPSYPGNIGTIVRTCDALGGGALVIVGHAADPYDPRAVRASTGSFFAVPIVEVGSVNEIVEWARAESVRVIATDEAGDVAVHDIPPPPLALVFGNEKAGVSRAWRDAADATVAIPMQGAASSLNVAAAHAVVLFSAKQG
jgi:TrmH family RNA methyltransferase